jgi:hypothetical protein
MLVCLDQGRVSPRDITGFECNDFPKFSGRTWGTFSGFHTEFGY